MKFVNNVHAERELKKRQLKEEIGDSTAHVHNQSELTIIRPIFWGKVIDNYINTQPK